MYFYFDSYIRAELEQRFPELIFNCFNQNINNEKDLNNLNTYLVDIKKYKVLTETEEKELFSRVQSGDNKAKELLIYSNLGLVIKIANKYRYLGVDILDLIQEGNIGLMKAIEKFQPNMNTRFSTLAGMYIENKISRAIENMSKTIRIPGRYYNKIVKYKKKMNELKSHIPNPTIEQISNELNLPKEEILKLVLLDNNTESIESFKELENNLNVLNEDFEGQKKLDSMCYDDEYVFKSLIHEELKIDINRIFIEAKLSKRDIEIVSLFYGLQCQPMSYSDIAKKYNFSIQGVRNIIASVLKKIRKTEYIYMLSSYMEDENLARENIDKYRKIYSLKNSYKKLFF